MPEPLIGDPISAARSSRSDRIGLFARHKRACLDGSRPDEGVESKPDGGRPWWVSPAPFTRNTGLAIVCPITSRVRPVPTSVVMPPGLSIAGEILTSHIRSIDTQARPIRCAGATVPDGIARLVRAKLDTLTTICEPDLRHGPSNPVQGAPGPLGECDNRPPRELA